MDLEEDIKMTNYDLIQELVGYPPDLEIVFKIGNLTGYDCSLRRADSLRYPELAKELIICIEE